MNANVKKKLRKKIHGIIYDSKDENEASLRIVNLIEVFTLEKVMEIRDKNDIIMKLKRRGG